MKIELMEFRPLDGSGCLHGFLACEGGLCVRHGAESWLAFFEEFATERDVYLAARSMFEFADTEGVLGGYQPVIESLPLIAGWPPQ